jgi:hypothetical protein
MIISLSSIRNLRTRAILSRQTQFASHDLPSSSQKPNRRPSPFNPIRSNQIRSDQITSLSIIQSSGTCLDISLSLISIEIIPQCTIIKSIFSVQSPFLDFLNSALKHTHTNGTMRDLGDQEFAFSNGGTHQGCLVPLIGL